MGEYRRYSDNLPELDVNRVPAADDGDDYEEDDYEEDDEEEEDGEDPLWTAPRL